MAMVNIEYSHEVPDSTYFRTGDAEPIVNGQTITLLDGRGSRRSWGSPRVTSTLVLDTPDLLAVHVGFSHKHGGGQFWRYYSVNGDVQQVGWRDLDDDLRTAVLEEMEKRAPVWARKPGKLRKNYKKPNPKKSLFEAYKIVAVDGDRMHSVYDPSVTYEIGSTMVERSRPDHRGGYYVHRDLGEMLSLFEAGELFSSSCAEFTVLRCECWGNTVEYASGKVAVTYCRPVEVVELG